MTPATADLGAAASHGVVWDAVIGQDAAIGALRRGLEHDRGAQGYLFAGPASVGKTQVAVGLAQWLNCQAEARPCGVCRPCRSIAAGQDPDIRRIEPERMGGSAAFRPRIHKIDTIRTVVRESALRTAGDRWRLLLLESADALRDDAANMLLKTLEEPPARMVFVLTTDQPDALLPTITSRLRRLDFGLVATATIEQWLREQHGVSAQQAKIDAALAAGRPGRALALSRDPSIQTFRRELLQRAARLGGQPAPQALVQAAWLLGGEAEGEGAGERVVWGLELLEWWFRDALVLATTGNTAGLVHQDFAPQLAEFVRRYPLGALYCCLAALAQARQALMRNGNEPLVTEVLWLRLNRGTHRLASPGAT